MRSSRRLYQVQLAPPFAQRHHCADVSQYALIRAMLALVETDGFQN